MTQLESARQGIITEKMLTAALAEGVEPEFIRAGIAAGNIIICHNNKHLNGTPLAVGKGLRTKVNANIGSSADDLSIEKELEKARVAVASSRHVLDLAQARYDGGVSTYLDVITAQQGLLTNERLAAQLQGQSMITSVFLVKALGGDWQGMDRVATTH